MVQLMRRHPDLEDLGGEVGESVVRLGGEGAIDGHVGEGAVTVPVGRYCQDCGDVSDAVGHQPTKGVSQGHDQVGGVAGDCCADGGVARVDVGRYGS